MLTVDQALEFVAEQASSLSPERVALREALGHVLAAEVASDIDSPPHHKAMMDGFAVVANDTSAERKIVEEIMAGDVPRRAITPGSATRVMTGAPVPDGATAVVPVERTHMAGDRTVYIEWLDPPVGAHIMRQGSSLRIGQQVLAIGAELRPIEIAILAEVGQAVVSVVPRPKVAILATGNELTEVHEKPTAGHIRNTNGPMLAAAIAAAGALPLELPVGRDDPKELTGLVRQGLEADVLLVTGGVSAGVMDLVPAAIVAAGARQVFHKVALKPGKPLWFGVAQRDDGAQPPRLVFGLPGNPVSGLVCFHLFVKPALEVLAGRRTEMALELTRGHMGEAFDHRGGRETFRPARATRSPSAHSPTIEFPKWRGSADVAGLAPMNCLVRLPADPLALAPGDPVDFLPLGERRV